MTRFWDGRTDGRTECTPRPAFAFGDAGKNHEKFITMKKMLTDNRQIPIRNKRFVDHIVLMRNTS